jgi:WD40 repeat protein
MRILPLRSWLPHTVALLWTLCALAHFPAQAQNPADYPTEPILQTETGMHTAPINRIAVDRAEQFLVSGSDDKTVRVWELASGRLLRTLHVPLGPGSLGKVYAVALSPDGQSIAVGGYTGPSLGNANIYIFDRATGELRHRIAGLPNVITHLAYSPDGRHLAAVFEGANGLRVYETGTYREVAQDSTYEDAAYWVAFDLSGRLVSTSLDGYLRLYDAAFQLRRKVQTPGGKQPFAAAFSPDGRHIAVGYDDSTQVDVFAAKDLQRAYAANTTGVTNGYLSKVTWSRDGRFLYAAGRYGVSGKYLIRRWEAGGKGAFVEWQIATNTVMSLIPLADGRLAVGAADPLVAVLDARGAVRWQQRSVTASFWDQQGSRGIRVSRTGDVVQFGFERGGQRPARFAVQDARLTLNPPADDSLAGPVIEAPGLQIRDWVGTEHPTLNGKPLTLDRYEMSRSLAIAPDGQRFLLGTAWRLRLFARDGTESWHIATLSVARAVNITPDGRTAVVGFEDGTLRWYRLQDGVELLAFFPQTDGQRWVLWTPQGYYQASVGGEDLIGWHLNQGLDIAPAFYGASRFREQFYRPDVIARVLTTLDSAEALRLADQARGQQTRPRDVRSVLPPQVTILSPAPGTKTTSNQLTLLYKAASPPGPVTAIEVRVNSRPAQEQQHTQQHFQDAQNSMMGQVTVLVPPEHATVEVIARNQHGASEAASFLVTWEGGADWYKPRLYVLAVGVSTYQRATANLKWAAKDASDFLTALQAQKGGLYKDVTVRLLPDDKATREAILQGLEWLQRQTTSRDVAVVFLAGHGIRGDKNEYYFLPHDGDPDRLGVTAVRDFNLREDFLSRIAGKTVLFLDTCYSGGLRMGGRGATDSLPDVVKFANELASADAGVIVFASSTGRERSVELETFKHGAFTQALLEGISGRADYTKDGYVSIAELETYVAERVKSLTEGKQKPVTAKPEAVENYRILHVP